MNEGTRQRSHWRRNFAICAIVISLPSLAYLYATREWEESDFGDAQWEPSGRAGVFCCTVTDAEGRPVAGARVDIDNNSGGTGGTTDENGRVELRPGESELSGIAVNRVWLVRRRFADELGSPSVKRGLDVRIRLKDLAAFEMSNNPALRRSVGGSDRDRMNAASKMAE